MFEKTSDHNTSDDPLPPSIVNMMKFLQLMLDDAAAVADAIRNQVPLTNLVLNASDPSVINYQNIKHLFVDTKYNEDVTYLTYYYSNDMKSLDSLAQFNISKLVSQAMVANGLAAQMITSKLTNAEGAILIVSVDRIIAMTSYLKACFGGFKFGRDLITGRLQREDLEELSKSFVNQFMQIMDDAKTRMVQPNSMAHFIPYKEPRFIVEVARRFGDGQQFINGVFFTKEDVDVRISSIAKQNAEVLFSPQGG